MPLVESEAIILRSTPFSEADKLVSFLSRRFGRLRGVAPAARKSRRRFGPALEPLTHVRLWFFDRENRELVRLQECELIQPFWEGATQYESSVALSHIAELCELLLPEREPSERTFRLTLMTLQTIRQGQPIWLALPYFQLWSLRLAGWLPDLDRCSRCNRRLTETDAGGVSSSLDQLFCSTCALAGTRTLSAESRRAAAQILAQPLTRLVAQDSHKGPLLELQRYLLDLIEHHAEHKLATREPLHETA